MVTMVGRRLGGHGANLATWVACASLGLLLSAVLASLLVPVACDTSQSSYDLTPKLLYEDTDWLAFNANWPDLKAQDDLDYYVATKPGVTHRIQFNVPSNLRPGKLSCELVYSMKFSKEPQFELNWAHKLGLRMSGVDMFDESKPLKEGSDWLVYKFNNMFYGPDDLLDFSVKLQTIGDMFAYKYLVCTATQSEPPKPSKVEEGDQKVEPQETKPAEPATEPPTTEQPEVTTQLIESDEPVSTQETTTTVDQGSHQDEQNPIEKPPDTNEPKEPEQPSKIEDQDGGKTDTKVEPSATNDQEDLNSDILYKDDQNGQQEPKFSVEGDDNKRRKLRRRLGELSSAKSRRQADHIKNVKSLGDKLSRFMLLADEPEMGGSKTYKCDTKTCDPQFKATFVHKIDRDYNWLKNVNLEGKAAMLALKGVPSIKSRALTLDIPHADLSNKDICFDYQLYYHDDVDGGLKYEISYADESGQTISLAHQDVKLRSKMWKPSRFCGQDFKPRLFHKDSNVHKTQIKFEFETSSGSDTKLMVRLPEKVEDHTLQALALRLKNVDSVEAFTSNHNGDWTSNKKLDLKPDSPPESTSTHPKLISLKPTDVEGDVGDRVVSLTSRWLEVKDDATKFVFKSNSPSWAKYVELLCQKDGHSDWIELTKNTSIGGNLELIYDLNLDQIENVNEPIRFRINLRDDDGQQSQDRLFVYKLLFGDKCHIDDEPYCLHGGTCKTSSEGNENGHCECTRGYSGMRCENEDLCEVPDGQGKTMNERCQFAYQKCRVEGSKAVCYYPNEEGQPGDDHNNNDDHEHPPSTEKPEPEPSSEPRGHLRNVVNYGDSKAEFESDWSVDSGELLGLDNKTTVGAVKLRLRLGDDRKFVMTTKQWLQNAQGATKYTFQSNKADWLGSVALERQFDQRTEWVKVGFGSLRKDDHHEIGEWLEKTDQPFKLRLVFEASQASAANRDSLADEKEILLYANAFGDKCVDTKDLCKDGEVCITDAERNGHCEAPKKEATTTPNSSSSASRIVLIVLFVAVIVLLLIILVGMIKRLHKSNARLRETQIELMQMSGRQRLSSSNHHNQQARSPSGGARPGGRGSRPSLTTLSYTNQSFDS